MFGVYAPGQPVAQLTYAGLYALQHRGQESAGLAVSDGDTITVVKDMGLVTNAFDSRTLAPLQGHLAIGHVRYSTTGSSSWDNAQPCYRSVGEAGFALGHNGNLVNTPSLALETGTLTGTVTSDSDVVAELVSASIVADGEGSLSDGRDLERALMKVLPRLQGAFSFVLMDDAHLIGVRDPNGFRPLCLGRLPGGWVLASETPALDIIGAHFVRELEPGGDGRDRRHRRAAVPAPVPAGARRPQALHLRVRLLRPTRQPPLRPDRAHRPPAHGRGAGRPGAGRRRHGDAGARVGDPRAEGYARRSGIPFGHGLVKNRYIGRTFIAPSQEMRNLGVRMKLNPIRENIAGKRLVVVDDSIVRGTTQRAMVRMLREAGVKEVHLRISLPPVAWPCFFGMDFGTRTELLAASMSVGEIREYLGCDSLAYLDLDRLVEATGTPRSGFCTACLTGEYPIDVPITASGRSESDDVPAPAPAPADQSDAPARG